MLTTLSLVKTRLKLPDSDVVDDGILTYFIQLVSARFENDANRRFAYGPGFDEFEGHETELRVSRYPIDQAQPITFDILRLASIGWESVTNVEFLVRKNCVVSLVTRLGEWKQNLRLSYFGGFVLPDADPVPTTTNPLLPDDLQLAASEQVAYWYQNKDRLGLRSLSGAGASIAHIGNIDLLPSVLATIKKYERWMP